jgi:hypothetical protein
MYRRSALFLPRSLPTEGIRHLCGLSDRFRCPLPGLPSLKEAVQVRSLYPAPRLGRLKRRFGSLQPLGPGSNAP